MTVWQSNNWKSKHVDAYSVVLISTTSEHDFPRAALKHLIFQIVCLFLPSKNPYAFFLSLFPDPDPEIPLGTYPRSGRLYLPFPPDA